MPQTAPACPAEARSSFRVSRSQPRGEVRDATGAERKHLAAQTSSHITFQARQDKQQHSHSPGSWRPQRIPGPHPSQVTNCQRHPLPAPHHWGPHPAQEPRIPRALPGIQRPRTCPPCSALRERRALLQAREPCRRHTPSRDGCGSASLLLVCCSTLLFNQCKQTTHPLTAPG